MSNFRSLIKTDFFRRSSVTQKFINRIFQPPSTMPPAPVKPNVIRRIVHLKQLLKRWRNSASNRVPAGHIAVYVVGAQLKRFVIRASYLNHPIFKNLLTQAEEEFGFANEGPLLIPCDESTFDEVLHCVSRSDQSSSSPRAANLELLRNRCYGGGDFFSDSTPLAHEKCSC